MQAIQLDDTDKKVLRSRSPVLVVGGCVGSGKTTIFLLKLLQFAQTQMMPVNGVRTMMCHMFRLTEPELESTKAAMVALFPDLKIGGGHPWKALLHVENDDKTVSRIHVVLDVLADRVDIINRKFAGLLTNVVFINEVQLYQSPYILQKAQERVGRYGDISTGNVGNSLVFADFNHPSESHWLKDWRDNPPGSEKSDGGALVNTFKAEIIEYPPALIPVEKEDGTIIGFNKNPAAEGMYRKRAEGHLYWTRIAFNNIKNRAYIYQNILGKFGYAFNGKPVYDGYFKKKMIQVRPFDYGRMTYLGVDPSGFNSAALVTQRHESGRLHVFKEFPTPIPDETTFTDFLDNEVEPWLKEHQLQFRKCKWIIDPANKRNDTTSRTPRNELNKRGFLAQNAPGQNRLQPRFEAVKWHMYNGLLTIDPECKHLIRAIETDYHIPKGKDKPAQNHTTGSAPDLAASLEYLCIHFRMTHKTPDAVKTQIESTTEFLYDDELEPA